MGRPAPPLQMIQAFLAATRSQSFRLAAEEVGLSPSAFSRRISSLEALIGVSLYDRTGPAPRLTEAGEAYCRRLEPAVEAIQQATDAVRGQSRGGRVRVMCPPSFAINWLMPHLKAYFDLRGREDVDIVISRELDTLRLGRAELGIAIGPKDFGDLPAEPLLRLRGAVVSAPMLACGRPPPRSVAELQAHRLLALAPPADAQYDLWAGWRGTAGYPDAVLPEPVRFDTWALMYEAAANGLGVAIAVPAVSEAYLRAGRLRPCFESRADLRASYSLVFASPEVARRREVRELVAWLTAQMQTSETVFSQLVAAA